MSGTLQLDITCPECHSSMMDPSHTIDHVPSVKAVVGVDGVRGIIHLSSVYGSYAIESDIDIPRGTVAALFCPDCGSDLSGACTCELCQAPLLSFRLRSGGKVNICSRRGCKKHFLEFQNNVLALSRLYAANSIGSTSVPFTPPRISQIPDSNSEASRLELIRNGAFLSTYCPHCQQGLTSARGIQLAVINRNKSSGDLFLSPYLNVFTHESTVEIPESEEVADLRCPHCHITLMIPEHNCEECNSRIAGIQVSAMRKLITFFICMKKGCHWHGVSMADTHLIALEDSLEW